MSLIILERDGVINARPVEVIRTPAEWSPLEGALESMARLNQAGYRIIVLVDSPGMTQDRIKTATLTAIHSKMRRMLVQLGGRIEAVLFDRGEAAGTETVFDRSLSELSRRLRLDLTAIPAIGSSAAFMQAAQAMKARTFLIQPEAAQQTSHKDVVIADSLQAATDSLLDKEA